MTRLIHRRSVAGIALAATAMAILTTGSGSASPAGGPPATAAPASISPACGDPGPGEVRCLAMVQDTTPQPTGRTTARAASLPTGLAPADVRSAYGLQAAIDAGAGKDVTIAVVGAYDAPTIEADLAVYRQTYGLPPCTTDNGCFRKVNDAGEASPLPAPDFGWSVEMSLDVQAISATCPSCNILLVEALAPSFYSISHSVDTAVALGADIVSNSYGAAEGAGIMEYDSAYDHPGVPMIVASGDFGYQLTPSWPATRGNSIAVGGTTLTRADNDRGWTETAWAMNVRGNAAGAGCSAWYDKPSWQTDTACPGRTVADISAVGDPATGFAVYNTTPDKVGNVRGWLVVGGTSLSAPLVAGMYGLAGNTDQVDDASHIYSHREHLYDVVGGSVSSSGLGADCPASSYICTAVEGYDGPTGLGSPNGLGALTG